jgi:hypothetical protein
MQRSGVAHTMTAAVHAGATHEGLALYRELRNLLELREFRGLAAEQATAFGAFEETVAMSVAKDPLTDEPDPILEGGKMVGHDVRWLAQFTLTLAQVARQFSSVREAIVSKTT